ncbi:MAG: helix-turn-helix domain-containing protein [Phaeodactylibacter sp.]|uniref:helix-turn-helix domain-containing protein n=1 Tax=Phaeodactylibacter sp. TaxID=1940289 RepID=UPI0032ECDEEE
MAKTPFSRNLKSLRRARGLSQQKLAQEVGLKRSNIASYETGSVEPSVVNFLKIACCFEVPPSRLLEAEIEDHPVLNSKNTPQQEHLVTLLSQFSLQTTDAHKVAQGFREYLRLSSGQGQSTELTAVLNILEHLVSVNQQFMGH